MGNKERSTLCADGPKCQLVAPMGGRKEMIFCVLILCVIQLKRVFEDGHLTWMSNRNKRILCTATQTLLIPIIHN